MPITLVALWLVVGLLAGQPSPPHSGPCGDRVSFGAGEGDAVAAGLTLTLPEWLNELEVASSTRSFATAEERMRLAIEAARRGSAAGDGGPFGAAMFETASGMLVALGANLVLATGCTVLHAEVVALTAMQQRLRCGRLLPADGARYELVTSAEPCAMCLGAVVWSGVGSVVIGARDADVRAIGFDEGDKPPDWSAAYQRRGIRVCGDVLREEAVGVLRAFLKRNGTLY